MSTYYIGGTTLNADRFITTCNKTRLMWKHPASNNHIELILPVCDDFVIVFKYFDLDVDMVLAKEL